MNFWERFVKWLEDRTPPSPPPEVQLPEYDRPYVRRTRPQDDAAADEALAFIQEYVRGVRADRDRRPPRR